MLMLRELLSEKELEVLKENVGAKEFEKVILLHPYEYLKKNEDKLINDSYSKYLENLTFEKALDYLSDLPFDEKEDSILYSAEPFLNVGAGAAQEELWAEMEDCYNISIGRAFNEDGYIEANKNKKYVGYSSVN